jgi:hypothetical protein
MLGAIQISEVLTSLLHIVSLSIAMARLAENDLLGALLTIGVGCLCVISLAAVIILCELARWYVRQYLRNRELRELRPGPSGLERPGN